MAPRNLLLSLLVIGAAVGAFAYWHGHRKTSRRTIVLISIDTQRPDRLGLYGNAPDVSPVIDALGPQSVVFDQALANSPYTLPSHMTMLTGLDPVAHGVKREGCKLSSKVTTLAMALRHDGFECGAFTDGGYVSARYGFSQGFHKFDDHRDERPDAVNGMSRIVPLALNWLDQNEDEDVFLFVHTFDVHAPYQVGDPDVLARFRQRPVNDGAQDYELHRLTYMQQQKDQRIGEYGRMAELLNDYDAGVFEADRGVGRIEDWLKQHGRFDNALFIVTADHGESFADHGIHVGHGVSLTDDEIHIPLVMKLPHAEGAGKRLDQAVSLVDLAPTVLDVFGLPAAPEMQGESLLGLVHGQARRHDYVFGYSPNTESIYLLRDGWKYISPPSIPPMMVAQRHLGPTLPPTGGPEPPDAEDYDFGPKDKPIKLRYANRSDPLAIRDVILTGNRLYDRAKDPQELTNLWEEQFKSRGQAMSEFARAVMEDSLKLDKSLEDGTESSTAGQAHVDQTLAQLGYAGAPNQATALAYLQNIPAALRAELQHPFQGPDMTDLVEADKIMQVVRMAQRDGRQLKRDIGPGMTAIGNRLEAWAVANPDFKQRVGWRLDELAQLADNAHLPVDSSWLGKYRDWLQKQADAAPAPDGSAADTPRKQADAAPPDGKPAEETPAKSTDKAADPPR